ncbi:MAG: CotH kinase family protein, partial [Oscillospiraceae bacterium]|nr:CotH kinase family protein [Oscillospiraceae bacterium]
NNGGNIRYSLQFKLNKYVKSQTYHGLDTFCVNNMMGDATYMKDYLSFAIMDFIGVATPLVNYAHVTVSGEDYGFGLVLERYDKAFLDRVYSTSGGQLYNVKIGMGMRGDFEAQWQDVTNHMPNRRQRGTGAPAEGPQGPGGSGSGGPGGGPGGGGSGSGDPGGGGSGGPGGGPGVGNPGGPGGGPAPGGGGSGPGGLGVGGDEFPQGGALIYTDDEISSYNAIFDNSVFKSSDREKRNVITAIKHLNAGTDFEKSWDVDQIIRYFAAHTVLVNLDSYTSNMQQNYYLYERNGKVTVLPWDYGLAFGGFLQSGDASSVVNYPIDTPVSGVSMEERPLLNKLLEVDEYREAYHGYLRQIVEGYFESGQFESTIRGLDAKINEYVKNNVNVYYTYKQYEASLPVLTELGRLRAVSIKAQLDGTIPSTSHGQRAFSSSLIDASGISLSVLGAMSGGRGG